MVNTTPDKHVRYVFSLNHKIIFKNTPKRWHKHPLTSASCELMTVRDCSIDWWLCYVR